MEADHFDSSAKLEATTSKRTLLSFGAVTVLATLTGAGSGDPNRFSSAAPFCRRLKVQPGFASWVKPSRQVLPSAATPLAPLIKPHAGLLPKPFSINAGRIARLTVAVPRRSGRLRVTPTALARTVIARLPIARISRPIRAEDVCLAPRRAGVTNTRLEGLPWLHRMRY
jgi:hypothetical protein